MRRMDTVPSIYSYDARQGHGEIDMHGGELRSDYEKFKYRSDRASASVKDFFDKMDDEKESRYSVDDEQPDSGVGSSICRYPPD